MQIVVGAQLLLQEVSSFGGLLVGQAGHGELIYKGNNGSNNVYSFLNTGRSTSKGTSTSSRS